VRDPHGVLAEFGVTLPEGTSVRVWDSTAEVRYLVLPMRPEGSERLSEDELAALVTRDSMIGTGLPLLPPRTLPAEIAMTHVSHADLGGTTGHGPIVNEPEDERFHAGWEPRVLAVTLAMGATGLWNIDMSRAARESLPTYARLTYYEIWFEGLLKLLAAHALVADDELQAGHSLHAARELPRKLHAANVPTVLANGASTERPATTEGALQGRRRGAHVCRRGAAPHAAAALRARPARRGRACAWRARVRRCARHRPRRAAALAVHRGLRRA
jgi:hypothetical protein